MSTFTGGAAPGDLELLRMHVAAVWGVRLPPPSPEADLLPGGSTPPWTLYLAEVNGGRLLLWRREADPVQRDALALRAQAALALPPTHPTPPGITREVALRLAAPPRVDPSAAGRVARALRPEDRALVAAFAPGEPAYYLDEPARAPVLGAFDSDRLVSVAHSSRRTHAACELGIHTLPEARRAGYGLAVTVLWTRAVAAEGIIPLYSALAENAASLGLAAAAGYRPFARAAYVR